MKQQLCAYVCQVGSLKRNKRMLATDIITVSTLREIQLKMLVLSITERLICYLHSLDAHEQQL